MGGNKQRKSSSSFFSIFNIFSSKKSKGAAYYDAYDSGGKVWPSDYDRDQWGAAEPGIDKKAEAFILNYKRRISESERFEFDPAA
ncbi:hypothetical protein RIF29_22212 [Crotalaria pallida]|uniref:Uncharacterized protein n=1 Tax=Crotalaria pallida TaxID=3830 RepID=A0AAN9I6N4_CROPI